MATTVRRKPTGPDSGDQDDHCPGVRGYRYVQPRPGGPALPVDAVVVAIGPADRRTGPVTVYGLHTRPWQWPYAAGQGVVEIALEPWAAYRLFGVPMHRLTDVATDGRQLPGVPVADLAGAAWTGDWSQRRRALGRTLAAWQSRARPCLPYVRHAWQLLIRSGGTVSVAELAAAAHCSERSLERGFREQIGLPPKTAGRLVRFRRALTQLLAGSPAAQVAIDCGYYDQAHLTREFSAMTDRSISRYLAERRAAGAGPALMWPATPVGFVQDGRSPRPAGSSI